MDKSLKDAANLMQDAATRVAFHAKRGVVTHTQASIKNVVRQVAFILGSLEKRRAFGRRFETAIMQAQNGPVEVQIRGKDIFIQGAFDLEMLRRFIVVNDPTDIITIPVMGPSSE